MNDEAVVPESPRWERVFLVCKACSKRSKGPKGLKPKEVASLVRRGAKGGRPRPRILLTTCLGLCPKAATAVAVVDGHGLPRIVAVKSRSQVDAAILMLAPRA